MSLDTRERLETCPYNHCHQILPHRLPQHLIKCRKNYPEKKMEICPFNATHHIEAHHFQAHIKDCKNKKVVERDLYRSHQLVNEKDDTKQPSPERFVPLEVNNDQYVTEDWDAEALNVAYDPGSSVLDREIVRQPPVGLGKSTRVAWRKAEEERIRRIREGRPIDDIVFPTKSGTATIEEMRDDRFYPKRTLPSALEDDDEDAICKSLMQMEVKTRKPMIMTAGLTKGLCQNGPTINMNNRIPGPSFGRGRIPFISSEKGSSVGVPTPGFYKTPNF